MSIKIKLFATLREKAGTKEINLEAGSIKEALNQIVEENEELEEVIFRSQKREELEESITVIKDGRNIIYLDGLETELDEGDTVSVFPAVGGG